MCLVVIVGKTCRFLLFQAKTYCPFMDLIATMCKLSSYDETTLLLVVIVGITFKFLLLKEKAKLP